MRVDPFDLTPTHHKTTCVTDVPSKIALNGVLHDYSMYESMFAVFAAPLCVKRRPFPLFQSPGAGRYNRLLRSYKIHDSLTTIYYYQWLDKWPLARCDHQAPRSPATNHRPSRAMPPQSAQERSD